MHPRLRPNANDQIIWSMVFDNNLYGLHDLKDAIVIDVGAHIGSFTRKAMELGAATIVSVEANPDNFAVLEANTEDASFVIRRLAALDYGALALVPVSAVDSGNTGRVYSGLDANNRAQYFVPNIRLEAILDLVGSERVDILKLDCQGAEWQVFNQASSSVWGRIGEIVGEIHADLHLDHLLAFLTSEIGRNHVRVLDHGLRPRDWAISAVRSFAHKHGFEAAFSLDDEDENSAEFHAYRRGVEPKCAIAADA